MKKLMIIEWVGSSFETNRLPRPQRMISTGFYVGEDDISITIASHYRIDVTESEKAIAYARGYFQTCIRKSQIVKQQNVFDLKETDDDLT